MNLDTFRELFPKKMHKSRETNVKQAGKWQTYSLYSTVTYLNYSSYQQLVLGPVN